MLTGVAMKRMGAAALVALAAFAGMALHTGDAQAQMADKWGALAFNARGAYGSVWNHRSQESAQRAAMLACRRNATIPCKVVSGANAACAAIASGTRGTSRTVFAVVRPGLARARSGAMQRCQSAGYNGCYIRGVMCADGSHKR